jgi:CubicO group peptidase (beta-lactamase class C family)
MQNDFLKNGLDALAPRTLECWHVPGLALAVVSGDGVLHLAGYGLRQLTRGLPVTPDTLFPIASPTKSFAAMSFGLLVDEGKLEWDKPARDYLPGWQMFDQVSTETVTALDFRCFCMWNSQPKSNESMARFLRHRLRKFLVGFGTCSTVGWMII